MTSIYTSVRDTSVHTPDHPSVHPGDAQALAGKRILLLSAYDAASHRYWREQLVTLFAQCQWTCLTLPARYFAWRVRGNSLSWAFNHRRELTDNHDLVIATSLCDLASLRGFVPELAQIPTLLYFHENQLAYPDSGQQYASVEPAMVNLYSALCADRLAFNSEWNRHSFFNGVEALLRKLPDEVPAGLPALLHAKSLVLPVPLHDDLFAPAAHVDAGSTTTDCIELVWNHRHEHDKGPERLLLTIQALIQRGLRFRLHLLGQRFRQRPAAFVQLEQVLADYYATQGMQPGINRFIEDRHEYEALLRSADIVLSTADHDFQGLAMLEAAALGCVAIAPRALAYPEYLPASGLYPVQGLDLAEQADAAADSITRHARQILSQAGARRVGREVADCVLALKASSLAAPWQDCLLALCKAQAGRLNT